MKEWVCETARKLLSKGLMGEERLSENGGEKITEHDSHESRGGTLEEERFKWGGDGEMLGVG